MTCSIKKALAGICLFLGLIPNIGLAQYGENAEFASLSVEYPDEPVIYLKRKTDAEYSLKEDSVIIVLNVYEEMLHLHENTTRYSQEKVYSSTFYKVSDIIAYTLIPHKKSYRRIDVKNIKESFDKNSSVFYDDSKQFTFHYPSIQRGAKTVLKYQIRITNPRLINLFYLNSYVPVDQIEYTVKYEKNIEVASYEFNTDSIALERSEGVLKDNRSLIKFTAQNVAKRKSENASPSFRYYTGTLYNPVRRYRKTDGTWTELISDTESLHSWYRSFLGNILGPDEAVKKLAESIVEEDDSNLDKVRKIYYWAQSNIKYIAFEDGMRGFIPHNAKFVIDKRYGDCKDMASLIVGMLRELGIEAQYTWVGSRTLPYKYSELPSPVTDNHMIATVNLDGTTYYLDATGQYTPLMLPTSMIQGKECLISYTDDSFEVKEIPIIPKETSIMTDSVFISLEDRSIKGSGQVHLTGYAKVFNMYRLIKSNQNTIDNYVKRLLTKGSNKFQLDDFAISNTDKIKDPIEIQYDFNVSDYYSIVGEKLYINLNLDRTMTDNLLEDRETPYENEYKYINRNVTIMTIPEGYNISVLPEDAKGNDENFGYSISYVNKDSKIIVTKEFYLDFLVLEPDAFESWNKQIKDYAKACRNAIILERANN
jgi:transglutaminase-like putative cysteine protease